MTGLFLISTYNLCRTKFFPFGYSLYFPLRMIGLHDVRKGTSLASSEIHSRPHPCADHFHRSMWLSMVQCTPCIYHEIILPAKKSAQMSLLLITTLYILTPYLWPLIFLIPDLVVVDGQDISKCKAKKLQSKCPNNVAVGIYTVRLTSIENKKWQKTAFESCNSHAFPLKLTVIMPN